MATHSWGTVQHRLQPVPVVAVARRPAARAAPDAVRPAVHVVPAPRLTAAAVRVRRWSLALAVTQWLLAAALVAARVDRWQPVATVAAVVVAVVGCGVLTATWAQTAAWLHDAVAAARVVAPRRMRHRASGAWFGWLVPGAALYLPPILVRDAWAVGARGRPDCPRPDLGGWWTFWLAGVLAQLLPWLVLGAGWASSPLWTAFTGLGLLLVTLALHEWCGVVTGLTGVWESRRPTAGSPGGAAG